jgi:hypothetical protein
MASTDERFDCDAAISDMERVVQDRIGFRNQDITFYIRCTTCGVQRPDVRLGPDLGDSYYEKPLLVDALDHSDGCESPQVRRVLECVLCRAYVWREYATHFAIRHHAGCALPRAGSLDARRLPWAHWKGGAIATLFMPERGPGIHSVPQDTHATFNPAHSEPVNYVGSESAGPCVTVALRDPASGMTRLAHASRKAVLEEFFATVPRTAQDVYLTCGRADMAVDRILLTLSVARARGWRVVACTLEDDGAMSIYVRVVDGAVHVSNTAYEAACRPLEEPDQCALCEARVRDRRKRSLAVVRRSDKYRARQLAEKVQTPSYRGR